MYDTDGNHPRLGTPPAPPARDKLPASLTVIGPVPPPMHGQSMATGRIFTALNRYFAGVRLADTSEGVQRGWRRTATKLRRSVAALRAIRGSDAVYISVNVGPGMWLSTIAAAVARGTGARLFLHHHSYSYVRTRTRRMVALTRVAGSSARHIVLSATMAAELQAIMPEVRRVVVLGNAALVDQDLLDLPLREDGCPLVLGHLSNLRRDKGIAEVIDLAVAVVRAGVPARLIVAGPTVDAQSEQLLGRATAELGSLFEYLGPVGGREKSDFYRQITHFVFPSRYVHEAVPLVLYEAMAAGAVCMAIRRGSIVEQLDGSPGLLSPCAETFVQDMLPALVGAPVSADASRESRLAYRRALTMAEKQLDELALLLVARNRPPDHETRTR